jgi:hypothetical protein
MLIKIYFLLYVKSVLKKIHQEIKLDIPWIENQVITSSEPVVIKDINNDVERELALYILSFTHI